jgi:hypothetical protein
MDFRQKHGFGSMHVNQATSHVNINCGFVDEKNPTRQRAFQFECHNKPVSDQTLKIYRTTFGSMAKDAVDIPNLGRAAWAGSAMGVQQVHVWDDKTDCELTIILGLEKPPPDEFVHPEPFARETLAMVRTASGR